jgi:hypothetical protein
VAWHRDLLSLGIEEVISMPGAPTDRRTSGPPFERSEMGGGDPDGSAGGAGGKAPRGIERLHRYLERLADGAFYGKVIVSFQHGKVHDIKVEQTKKLDEL